MRTNYLIVGGGIAGTTAAETIRAHDSTGSITVVSDEPYRLYSRIMLSKPGIFLGRIPLESIWLKRESWYDDHRINLFIGKRATALDTTQQRVTLTDGTECVYEKLLLAVGTRARRWSIAGAEKRGVFYLRTLDDCTALIASIKTARQALLIGSGFVSFETADMLRQAGIQVTIVMLENHYWEPLLDATSGALIENALRASGVTIKRTAEVQEIQGDDSVKGVLLKNGERLPCDMIVCGIGTVCPTDWLKSAGIATNRGILANEYLETNVPHVWTAGDAAEFNDLVLGETIQLGNWVHAQEQGRTAGMNMVGQQQPFRFVSFYSSHSFGTTIAFVGDIRPDATRTVVTRGSQAERSHAQLLLANAKLLGAVLINRPTELQTIRRLIEQGSDLSAVRASLSDATFNLQTLLTP